MGRGVVVTSCRGVSPRRRPNCSMSQVSCGYFHLPSSSAQAMWNCGPRRLSGSSEENTCAIAPFGQRSRRRDTSKAGRWRRAMRQMPEMPSIITSRASPSVSATSAMRKSDCLPADATRCTHSAPARVLPEPRPPISSHVRQSPSGGCCGRLPMKRQSRRRLKTCAGRWGPVGISVMYRLLRRGCGRDRPPSSRGISVQPVRRCG